MSYLTTSTRDLKPRAKVQYSAEGAPFASVLLDEYGSTYISSRVAAEFDALAAEAAEAARLLRAAEPHQPQATQNAGGQS